MNITAEELEKVAEQQAVEYAKGYDSGPYREYAEDDFLAGWKAAITYLENLKQ